jgi:hypothetical protein
MILCVYNGGKTKKLETRNSTSGKTIHYVRSVMVRSTKNGHKTQDNFKLKKP